MAKSCSVEEGSVMNMGRMQDVAKMEEEVTKMLREVRKVVEQEEMQKKEEGRGIPKPSFLSNLVAIQQLHNNMPECPAPRKKKKAKKTVRFLLSTVSKRKLQMEEEEVEMSSLKKVKEERLLGDELEQIGFMMANMLPRRKK